MDRDPLLRRHVLELLRGGSAHLPIGAVLRDWPPALFGVKPEKQPHTAWRLLEHLRIAQHDILAFSWSGDHVSPDWPEGYWPPDDAPPTEEAWDASVAAFQADLEAMQALVADPANDLFEPFPWGEGQTLLREALLLADHNAYHQGQLVVLRRLLDLPAHAELP